MKSTETNSDFGKRLRRIRESKGLTQTKLAEISGISRRAIVHYESHVIKPPVDKINTLADILNVSIDELLGKKKSQKTNDIPFRIMKHVRVIEKLPVKDQNAIFQLIKSLADKNKIQEDNTG